MSRVQTQPQPRPRSNAPARSDAPRLRGLAPLVSAHTRLLILGSFPGTRSLQTQQYYAHPQNQFWPLLQALWPDRPQPASYAGRCEWLLARGLGLWDVYARCHRQGSLDSAIEDAELNDFSALRQACPQWRAVAHNGAESYRHRHTVQAAWAAWAAWATSPGAGGEGRRITEPLCISRLPSSSPAHARWSFERKGQVWRSVMQEAGLIDD